MNGSYFFIISYIMSESTGFICLWFQFLSWMKLFFYLINACNYAINYRNSPRETPSQKMTSPAGLSQRLRTHLPKTSHHTDAPPNSLPLPKKQQKNKQKTLSQTRTTPSITLHGPPPADHQHTNSPPQLTTKETPGDM